MDNVLDIDHYLFNIDCLHMEQTILENNLLIHEGVNIKEIVKKIKDGIIRFIKEKVIPFLKNIKKWINENILKKKAKEQEEFKEKVKEEKKKEEKVNSEKKKVKRQKISGKYIKLEPSNSVLCQKIDSLNYLANQKNIYQMLLSYISFCKGNKSENANYKLAQAITQTYNAYKIHPDEKILKSIQNTLNLATGKDYSDGEITNDVINYLKDMINELENHEMLINLIVIFEGSKSHSKIIQDKDNKIDLKSKIQYYINESEEEKEFEASIDQLKSLVEEFDLINKSIKQDTNSIDKTIKNCENIILSFKNIEKDCKDNDDLIVTQFLSSNLTKDLNYFTSVTMERFKFRKHALDLIMKIEDQIRDIIVRELGI